MQTLCALTMHGKALRSTLEAQMRHVFSIETAVLVERMLSYDLMLSLDMCLAEMQILQLEMDMPCPRKVER